MSIKLACGGGDRRTRVQLRLLASEWSARQEEQDFNKRPKWNWFHQEGRKRQTKSLEKH
jgi:hypothetical protein